MGITAVPTSYSYGYVYYQEYYLAHYKHPISISYYYINFHLSPQYIAVLTHL